MTEMLKFSKSEWMKSGCWWPGCLEFSSCEVQSYINILSKYSIILLANIVFQQVTSRFSKTDRQNKKKWKELQYSRKKEGVPFTRFQNHTRLQKMSLKRIPQN